MSTSTGADGAALQSRLVAFIRAFGLHRPDETPCGTPIPVSEAHALSVLADEGPLNQTDLVHHLGLGKSTVSRLVDQVVAPGWARRTSSPDDARRKLVELTPKGRDAAAAMGRARAARVERLLDRIPDPTARPSRPRSRPLPRPLMNPDTPPTGSHVAGLALRIALGASLVVVAACGQDGDDSGDRQADVAERGAEVMPFDLDATTHRFEPLDDGLLQTVVADAPADADEVALVREHLTDEAERFASGDFDDPASIHGDEMPGLDELRAGFADIDVTYAEVPDGATITYTTPDADLVAALHDWADAQVTDHGDHAEPVDQDAAGDG